MHNVRYTAKRLAEIVGATPKQVEGALGKKDGFAPEDLRALREKLRKPAAPFPPRVQLFLNFKGGTGKTSLSSSYAYRLAERGYRVLMIDLDSQGHATKCLGEEGGRFERTLHDVLIRKVPLEEVTVHTGMPGLDLVPANLAMSTIDLALMPLAGREFRLRNALQGFATRHDFVILDAVVRQCTKFAQASSEGSPIFGYDADSKGATDIDAAQQEILRRVRRAIGAAAGAAGA